MTAADVESVRVKRAELCAALRSGKYTQGHGYLRTHEGRFCCLGVACDLFDSSRWGENGSVICVSYGREAKTYPPSDVVRAFALDQYTADFPEALGPVLMRMNDIAGSTFEEIADFIEFHPLPEADS